MNLMFGKAGANLDRSEGFITKTAVVTLEADSDTATTGVMPDYFVAEVYDADNGSKRTKVYMDGTTSPADGVTYAASGITMLGIYAEDGVAIDDDAADTTAWGAVAAANRAGERAFIKYKVAANRSTISITGDSFPGTYYVTGDTYARSDITGKDQFFQFIVPKAKVTCENTITLEADGDPSVFSMSLTVLRPASGDMMQLVQYDLTD